MTIIQEFKTFAMRGNAIDLAVGVVIGAAFGQVTNSLVNDILTPPLALLTNGVDFTELSVSVGGAAIRYGALIETIINFVLIALALFLVIKGMNRLSARSKDVEKPAPESEELKVLKDIRDSIRRS